MDNTQIRATVVDELGERLPAHRADIQAQATNYAANAQIDPCLDDAVGRSATVFESFVEEILPGLDDAASEMREVSDVSEAGEEYLREAEKAKDELRTAREPVIRAELARKKVRDSKAAAVNKDDPEAELTNLRKEEEDQQFYLTGDKKVKPRIRSRTFVYGVGFFLGVIYMLIEVGLNYGISRSGFGELSNAVFVLVMSLVFLFYTLQIARGKARVEGAEDRKERAAKAERKKTIGVLKGANTKVAGVNNSTIKALESNIGEFKVISVLFIVFRLVMFAFSVDREVGAVFGTLLVVAAAWVASKVIKGLMPQHEPEDVRKWKDLQKKIRDAQKAIRQKNKQPKPEKPGSRIKIGRDPWQKYVTKMDAAAAKYRETVEHPFEVRSAFMDNVAAVRFAREWFLAQYRDKLYNDVVYAYCEGTGRSASDYPLDADRLEQITGLLETRLQTAVDNPALQAKATAMDPALTNPPTGRYLSQRAFDDELRRELESTP
jgi:hypothetical protein